MLRRLAKTALAYALDKSGAAAAVGAVRGAQSLPLVLGYHRVVGGGAAGATLPGMIVFQKTLERHLDWVGRRFRFASLDEVAALLEAGDPAAGSLATVTFDDGYSDVYENALPLLRRKGIPAAVFVVTDFVGRSSPPLYDRLYLALARAYKKGPGGPDVVVRMLEELRPALPVDEGRVAASQGPHAVLSLLLDHLPQACLEELLGWLAEEGAAAPGAFPGLRPLDWKMLGELRDAGFTIGSHTRSHALLTHESPACVREELTGSRAVLEERLGVEVEHFAYPDGRFDGSVVAAVAAAGYRCAYTICDHRDPSRPLLTVPRRMLWEGSCLDVRGGFSEAMLSCHANRVFDLFGRCARSHHLQAEPLRLAAMRG
jgi:peptidoglycan/xylan/chitin deacetylase (PgdA/CDA1 family)